MGKRKTILVTGGAGFIGSHLCKRLAENPLNRVISLDNYFTGSKENHVDGVRYIDGHTKDIEKHIKEIPDLLYHLGEYSRTGVAIEEPELVWDLNIVGTIGVLEFCRKNKCKLVYAGSSTKFSVGADGSLSGDALSRYTSATKGSELSPYSWSKSTNTDLVVNYGKWYGLRYAITYFYNAYGPGERSGRFGTVIEIFKQQYLNRKPLTVRLPGTQKRNYTFIDDLVSGLILVGESADGDGYGISADQSFGLLEVAEMFGGEKEMLPARTTSRPDSIVDNSKIKTLGWKQTKTLDEYIKDIKKKNK